MDTSTTAVATYIRDLFLPPDPQLEAALQRAADAGLRSIQVPPELGRLLGILVQTTGAVSYTHLDVYKRQGQISTEQRMPTARLHPAGSTQPLPRCDPQELSLIHI